MFNNGDIVKINNNLIINKEIITDITRKRKIERLLNNDRINKKN